MHIDINCDLGEGCGPDDTSSDEAVMPFITSANIACGFHAGDPLTIEKSVKSAIRHGVGIGAHPGYPDRGRVRTETREDEPRRTQGPDTVSGRCRERHH